MLSRSILIAFPVVCNTSPDFVLVPGFISNLDIAWDNPTRAYFFSRLSSFSWLILFDNRGTGLSDRVDAMPTLEERMDDVQAVMDAAGRERAALCGISEGDAMSVLFVATCPERTQALVPCRSYSYFPTWTRPKDRLETFLKVVEEGWGAATTLPYLARSKASDPDAREGWAHYERVEASPSAVISLTRMNSEIDVRHVLPEIRMSTLVVHREGDTRVDVEAARYAARSTNDPKLPGPIGRSSWRQPSVAIVGHPQPNGTRQSRHSKFRTAPRLISGRDPCRTTKTCRSYPQHFGETWSHLTTVPTTMCASSTTG
jgi:pimeloyl-ACP methyl ester carboxylesterase